MVTKIEFQTINKNKAKSVKISSDDSVILKIHYDVNNEGKTVNEFKTPCRNFITTTEEINKAITAYLKIETTP